MPASKRITAEATGMKATSNQMTGVDSAVLPNKKLTGKEKKLKRKEVSIMDFTMILGDVKSR